MSSSTKQWERDEYYDFSRDSVGYGEKSHNPEWPNNARIAVSFVLNYEEGGEHTVLNGDAHSEAYIREGGAGGVPKMNQRDTNAETEYDYGSRAGVWRIFRLFNKHDIKITVYAVGKALECNPAVAKSLVEHGHDVASHAYRWIDYNDMPPEEEKAQIRQCVKTITDLCGEPPKGWYTGRISPRSHTLLWEVYKEMDIPLLWTSDSYADDVPYWVDVPAEKDSPKPEGILIIPYTLDCNDFKFAVNSGFGGPSDFFEHCKNAFDVLYDEGEEGSPKMMSVGLHCRLAGKPGRFAALRQFVEYIAAKDGVWITTRTKIAEHFREKFPYKPGHLA